MNKSYFEIIKLDQEQIKSFLDRHPRMKQFINENEEFRFRICTQQFPGLLHAIISQDASNEDVLEITSKLNEILKSDISHITVLSLDDEQMLGIFKNKDKAELVKRICLDIKDKGLKLEELSKLPSDTIIELLSKYPYIKVQTIKEYLIFTCGKGDIFCLEDIDFLTGVYYYLQKKDWTVQDIYNIKDEYKGDETLFSLCMWKIRFSSKGTKDNGKH